MDSSLSLLPPEIIGSLSFLLGAQELALLMLSGDKLLLSKLKNGVRRFKLTHYLSYSTFPSFFMEFINLTHLEILVLGDYYFGGDIGTGALLHLPTSLQSLKISGLPVFQLTSKTNFLARLPPNLTELWLPCAIIKSSDLKLLPTTLTSLEVRYLDEELQHILPPNLTHFSTTGWKGSSSVTFPSTLRTVDFRTCGREPFKIGLPTQMERISGLWAFSGNDCSQYGSTFPWLTNFHLKGYGPASVDTLLSLPRSLTDLEISGAGSLGFSAAAIAALPQTLTRFKVTSYSAVVELNNEAIKALPPHLIELNGLFLLSSVDILPAKLQRLSVSHFESLAHMNYLPSGLTHLELEAPSKNFQETGSSIELPAGLTHLRLAFEQLEVPKFKQFPRHLTNVRFEATGKAISDSTWLEMVKKLELTSLRQLTLHYSGQTKEDVQIPMKKILQHIRQAFWYREQAARCNSRSIQSITLSDYDLFVEELDFAPVVEPAEEWLHLLPRRLKSLSMNGFEWQEEPKFLASSLPSTLVNIFPRPPSIAGDRWDSSGWPRRLAYSRASPEKNLFNAFEEVKKVSSSAASSSSAPAS
jgi:hypothetical protein